MRAKLDTYGYERAMKIVKREIDCALGTPSHGRLIKVRRLIKKYHTENVRLREKVEELKKKLDIYGEEIKK